MKSLCLSLLLLSLTAFGQAFTPRRPFVQSISASTVDTNPSSVLPKGMLYWYTANDLSNSPVSVWTDRIQGYNWWQTNNSLRPTWTTNVGVTFNGVDQFLHASNSFPASYWGMASLQVFKLERTTSSQDLFADLSGSSRYLNVFPANSLAQPNSANRINPIGTAVYDVIAAQTNYQQFGIYTNLMSAVADNTVPWGYNAAGIGFVGSGNGNEYAKFVLKEWIVWSNSAPAGQTQYLSFTTISNIHWYATNTWGYSP